MGYEDNVLVCSKNYPDTDTFLDHDENDPITQSYFSLYKTNRRPKKMRYLDDVYGIIDGVKNGYGKAILPKHLIQNEKDFTVLDVKKVLRVPVYLQFYKQPYYRASHKLVITDLTNYFSKVLQQES